MMMMMMMMNLVPGSF